jgi:hypothetical protein
VQAPLEDTLGIEVSIVGQVFVVCVNGEISAMHIQYGAKLAENLNN